MPVGRWSTSKRQRPRACEVTAQAEVWRDSSRGAGPRRVQRRAQRQPREDNRGTGYGPHCVARPHRLVPSQHQVGWAGDLREGSGDHVILRGSDPLLHRTFGAVVATDRPERIDDKTLRSARGAKHRFEIAVHNHAPGDARRLARRDRQTTRPGPDGCRSPIAVLPMTGGGPGSGIEAGSISRKTDGHGLR